MNHQRIFFLKLKLHLLLILKHLTLKDLKPKITINMLTIILIINKKKFKYTKNKNRRF